MWLAAFAMVMFGPAVSPWQVSHAVAAGCGEGGGAPWQLPQGALAASMMSTLPLM